MGTDTGFYNQLINDSASYEIGLHVVRNWIRIMVRLRSSAGWKLFSQSCVSLHGRLGSWLQRN